MMSQLKSMMALKTEQQKSKMGSNQAMKPMMAKEEKKTSPVKKSKEREQLSDLRATERKPVLSRGRDDESHLGSYGSEGKDSDYY